MVALKKVVLLSVLVLIVAGPGTLPLFGCSSQPGPALNQGPGIPSLDAAAPAVTETATFGVGWFWVADARFGSIQGVISTRIGYAGGGDTGADGPGAYHETIEIKYDPTQISYQDLLNVFWYNCSPTPEQLPDTSNSVIFYHNEEQKRLATESKQRLEASLESQLSTSIVAASEFYPAEYSQQKYYLQHTPELLREFQAIYPDPDDFINSTAVARVNGYVFGFGTRETLEEELYSYGLSQEGIDRLLELTDQPLAPACPVKLDESPTS
jgi:peptide-methionine (S)-S-oxide reductase